MGRGHPEQWTQWQERYFAPLGAQLALFSAVLLDAVSAPCQLETDNTLLAHYITRVTTERDPP